MLIPSRSAHPATHTEHVAASARLAESNHTVPGWHSVHGVAWLLSASAKPGSHLVHTTSPHPAYVPLAHAVHGVVGSESSSDCPAVQKLHVAWPLAANCPALQSSHSTVPTVREATGLALVTSSCDAADGRTERLEA